MTIRNRMTDALLKSMGIAHRVLLKFGGGRVGWTLGTMPVVELHTIGRRTGKKRTTVLTAPVHRDGRYCLVASKGGDHRHPEWYLNLVANPDVLLTVRGRTIAMRARTATGEERADLWRRISAGYRGYDRYQRRTGREIPVVVCEPRPPQNGSPASGPTATVEA